MSDTSHSDQWFEGFFKPAPQFNEADITRWITQKCIGYQLNYQTNGDQLQLSVFGGQAEMEDGRVKEVWFLQYPYGQSIPPEHSQYLFEQPRIDIPQKED